MFSYHWLPPCWTWFSTSEASKVCIQTGFTLLGSLLVWTCKEVQVDLWFFFGPHGDVGCSSLSPFWEEITPHASIMLAWDVSVLIGRRKISKKSNGPGRWGAGASWQSGSHHVSHSKQSYGWYRGASALPRGWGGASQQAAPPASQGSPALIGRPDGRERFHALCRSHKQPIIGRFLGERRLPDTQSNGEPLSLSRSLAACQA